MEDKMVNLPSGESISEEFYNKLISIKSKRPRMVIDKLINDGSCTTEELIEMGYSHAPRAKRDVVEQGIPIKTLSCISQTTGRKIAKYVLGDWEEYKKNNSLAKTKGRNNLSEALKQKLIAENGCKCALYAEEYPASFLQTDHRIPFEIGGDPADMMDTSKFMLLSPSANRAKSWACDHCKNWQIKDAEMCKGCYYAFPENYTHIAGNDERALSIVFRNEDIKLYDIVIEKSKNDNISIQESFKRILTYLKDI